jgi:hypothetical protein
MTNGTFMTPPTASDGIHDSDVTADVMRIVGSS